MLDLRANPRLKLHFAPTGAEPLAEQMAINPANRWLDGLEDQAVRLLSTSGTTGMPKVIRWDRDLLIARLKQVRDTGDITPDTRILTQLGLITTTGLRYPLAAWQIGAVVLLARIGNEVSDLSETMEGIRLPGGITLPYAGLAQAPARQLAGQKHARDRIVWRPRGTGHAPRRIEPLLQ